MVNETERWTLTVAEVASLLGVHELTVRAAIKRGQIPAVSVGRRVLVPRRALAELLDGASSANGRGSR